MKHLTKKYSKRLIWLLIFFWWISTIYVLAQIITELRFDDQLTTQFWSGIFTYRTDIDFRYGGNKKAWTYLPRTLETLPTPEIVTVNWWSTWTCYNKIRWLYYNNERGERIWPLDQNTLTGLQTLHTSYTTMQLSGWLFTNCTGLGGTSGNVYGQITLTQNTTTYYLIAWTTYNFTGNIHGTGLSWSLERTNNTLHWYVWDSYGGIGSTTISTWCVDTRSPTPDTVCSWSSFTQTSTCGNTQVVWWTKNCGTNNNWWWGGSTITKDNCTFNNTSTHNLPGANNDGIDYSPSYYDHTCDGPQSTIQYTTTTPQACSAYSEELHGAYSFARSFDITTIDQCINANLQWPLIRKDLAKMMVNFATYVFNRNEILVDDPRCQLFSDIANETKETKRYIQKACEYGLMWLESDGLNPQTKFDPYFVVNRAQFWTILSRFLWKWDNNVDNAGALYYVKHLQALKNAGIMTNISTPKMKELRGWVMLTMKRIYEKTK